MTFARASSYGSTHEKLAILVEHYHVLRHELVEETDRELQAIKRILLRACWDAIRATLTSHEVAHEQLSTLVGLYKVLWYELAATGDGCRDLKLPQPGMLVGHRRACWDAIRAILAGHKISHEQLATLVNLHQVLQHELAAAEDPAQQEELREHLRAAGNALWLALADALIRQAQAWLRSQLAQNLFANHASYAGKADVAHALALSAFADILQQLPKVDLHPRKDVRALLLLIAHRGLYAQNGKYLSSRSVGAGDELLDPIESGRPGAAMWLDSKPPAIPASDDFTSLTEARSYEQDSATALQSYIAQKLSPTEQAILRIRQREQPPVEFDAIAAELGPDWNANRVRVQYYRAMEKLRAYVEACVLTAMHDRSCAAEVWAVVRQALKPTDNIILQIRWRSYPPVEFANIAAELGADWTAARVRERHHNAMAYIFAHLRSLGLVDLG